VTVKKGNKLFVSYGYSPLQDIPWYRETFIKFKKDYPEMARQVMQNYGIKDRDDMIKNGNELPNMS
jgi:hypothetical protein